MYREPSKWLRYRKENSTHIQQHSMWHINISMLMANMGTCNNYTNTCMSFCAIVWALWFANIDGQSSIFWHDVHERHWYT